MKLIEQYQELINLHDEITMDMLWDIWFHAPEHEKHKALSAIDRALDERIKLMRKRDNYGN